MCKHCNGTNREYQEREGRVFETRCSHLHLVDLTPLTLPVLGLGFVIYLLIAG